MGKVCGRVVLIDSGMDEAELSAIAGVSRDSEYGPSVESLLKWGHLSILEFASVTFLIECPIFVARQLMRYRTAKYNERSLRHCAPESYYDSVKEEVLPAKLAPWYASYLASLDTTTRGHEIARASLPLSTMTKFVMQIDLRNFIGLCKQRLDKHAQVETQSVVWHMLQCIKPVYPTVYEHIRLSVEAS